MKFTNRPTDQRHWASMTQLPTPLPLTLIESGIMRWRTGKRIDRSNFHLCALELITAGNGMVLEGRRMTPVGPGDVILWRKRSAHRLEVGDKGFLHKRMVIIEGASLEVLLRGFRLWDRVRIPLLDARAMTGLFRTAKRVMAAKPEGYHFELSRLAYQMLLEMARGVHHDDYPPPVQRALRYMEQNVDKKLSLQELANVAGLSVYHFVRVFRGHIKRPPIDHFLDFKMKHAQALLRSTTMQVKEISLMVGVDNPLYFSTLFRRHTGVSPRAFRGASR